MEKMHTTPDTTTETLHVEAEMPAVVGTLIDFHDRSTGTKQRLVKLLEAPDFPFAEV